MSAGLCCGCCHDSISLLTRQPASTSRRSARRLALHLSDAELLANPYLIYEHDRFSVDPVAVGTVDRGVFPDDRIRAAHPLPVPSRVDDPVDPRRVRALIVDVLEDAAASGDSLRSQQRVVQEIRDRPLQPGCPISLDVMTVCAEALPPEVGTAAMASGKPAYQLSRLVEARQAISRQVNRRSRGTAEGRRRLEEPSSTRYSATCPADDDGDEEASAPGEGSGAGNAGHLSAISAHRRGGHRQNDSAASAG